MYEKLKQIDKVDVLTIYLALLLFAGYWFVEYATIFAFFIIGGLTVLKVRKTGMNKHVLLILFFMMCTVFFAEIVSSLIYRKDVVDIKLLLVTLISLVVACLLACGINKSSFKKNYISCMTVVAVVSIVANLVFIVTPSIFSIFPKLVNSNGRLAYYLLFTTVSDFSITGAQRNQGIFWEPGAFQIFLSLAYIFELSRKDEKPRKWILIIFLIAMITTYSTTGVIVGILLLTFTLSRGKGQNYSIKALMVVSIMLVVIVNITPKLTGFWQYTLVDKVRMVLEYRVGTMNDASSRMDSIVYPLREFLFSPILGIGEAGYAKIGTEAGHSIFTCTPINWLVKYGIFYGAVVIYGLWRFFKSDFENIADTVVIFTIFLLSISTEELSFNVILMAMCFQGYMYPIRIKARRAT